MTARKSYVLAATSGLLSLLVGCGGGNNDNSALADSPTNVGKQSAFVTDYTNNLAALNTYAVLNSSSLPDLFDGSFLDAGYSKQQVSDNLAQEASAMATAPELSLFPMVKLSGAVISDCNSDNICTLTATITNSDVDSTAVTFTSKLKFSNGKLRLLGDQLSA